MHGDRERCLAAGMDSYISKPLEVDTFVQAVAMLAPAVGASAAISQLVPLSVSSASESYMGGESHRHIFDLDRLRAQTLGKPELLARVVDLFLSDYPDRLSEIRAAAADGDAERVEATVHLLRGALRNLGADAADDAALNIEVLARQGDLARATNMCVELERELKRLHIAFEEAGLCAS
jgi:HPt (histidine-containing phosphotransfer) domain-containing protein